jgi:hypothetical protein
MTMATRDTPDQAARLPRNFAHWCRASGLTVVVADGGMVLARSRRKAHVAGCPTPVRHFRALAHIGVFQVCDGYFDRWANSVGAEVPLPASRAEFDAALARLLAGAEINKTTPAEEAENVRRDLEWLERDLAELEEEYGEVVAWAARHGRHGKYVRDSVRAYRREFSRLIARRRRKNRHLRHCLALAAA